MQAVQKLLSKSFDQTENLSCFIGFLNICMRVTVTVTRINDTVPLFANCEFTYSLQ